MLVNGITYYSQLPKLGTEGSLGLPLPMLQFLENIYYRHGPQYSSHTTCNSVLSHCMSKQNTQSCSLKTTSLKFG